MKPNTRLGWIGTGVMGLSMCGHLLGKGYGVTVYNRTKSKAQPLLDKGAQWGESPSCGRSETSPSPWSAVSFTEAILGTTLTVPTLEAPFTAGGRPGTPRAGPSGSRDAVCPEGKKSTLGDLLVTVEVDVPAELSDEQRAARRGGWSMRSIRSRRLGAKSRAEAKSLHLADENETAVPSM